MDNSETNSVQEAPSSRHPPPVFNLSNDEIGLLKKVTQELPPTMTVEELGKLVKKLELARAGGGDGVIEETDKKSDDSPEVASQTGLELEVDRSTDESDSYDRGQSDSQHLLGIFPEEIWIAISKKLDPSSLESLCNASLFFRDLFSSQRVLFLFPSVWNILAAKYHKPEHRNDSGDEEDTDSEDDDDNPFQAVVESEYAPPRRCNTCAREWKTKWYSRILKLRLVCRKWAKAIDSFYENLPCHFDAREIPKDVFWDTCEWTENHFRFYIRNGVYVGGRLVQEFLQHFEPSHGSGSGTMNPFFGRRCNFHLHMDEDQIFVPQDIYNLLEKYGHHIWHASIRANFSDRTRPSCYEIVRLLLERMPNLKQVEILCSGRLPEILPEGELTRVNGEISLNPLPTLEKLKLLRVARLSTAIFNELLRQNNHLAVLDLPEMYIAYDMYTVPLSKLRELKMNISKVAVFEKLAESAASAAWQLEKVDLTFDIRGTSDLFYVDWPDIFKMLEKKWADTLTEVELGLPTYGSSDEDALLRECDKYRLNLPKVKSLKVEMRNVSSLDFILPMKDSLEFLEVCLSFRADHRSNLYTSVRKEQVIQVLGCDGWMLESNIWKLFPKLLQIKIEGNLYDEIYTFTRKEWQVEMEQKLQREMERKRDASVQADLNSLQ